MTEQVKVTKNILRTTFPNARFKVRLKRAVDYARSSDRIIVTTEDIVVDRVIETLKRHASGIEIGQYGKVLFKSGNATPIMHDPTAGKTVDFDLCEFIEVKNPWQ